MIDERKIIIGLITSTDYCTKIKPFWNSTFIESATAKRLSMWAWDYYDHYKKAPGREIESIFFSNLKEGKLAKDVAEEIEQEILPSLSKEYEDEGFNLDYLTEETIKHFNTRHLTILKENIESLVAVGKIDEAEQIAKGFKSLGISSDRLNEFTLTTLGVKKKKRLQPVTLVKSWLREGELTIIYGHYGVGKSLLAIHVAYLLGLNDYEANEDCEIGKWQIKIPTGTLYVDGELGELEMEERINQFEWIGKQRNIHRMRIFSIPEYQLQTEDSFSLSDRKNQLQIIQWLKEHPTYKLIILDSASTLLGLVDENDNSEWSNKINPFLRDLRALKVACILLHHAGKDGKKGLRGASAMGAMAHNIFRLVIHPDKDISAGEAWFTIEADKQRAAGKGFSKFALHYIQDDDQKKTHWEITDNS